MKKLFLAFAILIFASSTSHADFFIGTDLADAQSGGELTLDLGSTSTLEIWTLGETGQNIRGVSFNLISNVMGIVNSSNLEIDALADRWPVNNLGDDFDDPTAGSDTGVLVNDAGLATLGSFLGTGITFEDAPIRLGTIDITADQVGAVSIDFSEGSNGVIDAAGPVTGFVTGSRSVSVVSAVPEPSSIAVLALVGGIAGLRRRRS
ncbi:PEP-CTERM sorting domain-containing protein [Mariniblastus fucicola]|uniref:Uncharacterized protein n=1 Tax=Mariniblastus fucicola TaxID=980251 RepID=A0A5B9PHC6_9BACT|nr:PEP-CTERM sorting domain-containing protein [Mariniblastus fucicola]QEG24026.1 hypothetical protein MFFC18_39370 [Mariniblastus fucicola]